MPHEAILQVRDLTVSFATDLGVVRAADGVSFDLSPGKTLALVGESGCGKSMTALSLLDLLPSPGRIESGEILIGDKNILNMDEAEIDEVRGQRIAMIFQEPMSALNPVFCVGDQIAEVLRVHFATSKTDAWDAAVKMMQRVGIANAPVRAKNYPHQLSGGMRQRVMIAMALICKPDILIADEPTTALDVTVQAQILDLMMEMQAELGTAILFISHDLGVVSEIADDVMVMYAGRIVERSPAATLFGAPLHPYTLGLLQTLPRMDRRVAILPALPGSVPDLRALPKGCRFSDRCRLAEDVCQQTDPELKRAGAGRSVACLKVAP
ncbi:MAG: ABC transporter ATP-binding protein [Rhodospirillales bacterium]|jgi:peptide/nickel transport system ATP-binding protein|nr:ABC transporter ATP-binding protein [Rhodospirillales bacterium]